MSRMTILTEDQLRQIMRLDLAAVECVEKAFHSLATQKVAMPPIMRLDIPEHHGEVDVKTAYVPGVDAFAIKISPGFFDNPKLGLPSVNGMMVLLSARTGLVEALLLDNGYLTDVRTAAAGAVAAKYLSRPDSKVAAVLGAGMQAQLQLEALMLVRPIRQARIWARDFEKAKATAQRLQKQLNIEVSAHENGQEAVSGADIIVTTTPSERPILKADWLTAGQHVTAMGSDAEHKNEIEPDVFMRIDRYIADSLAQTRRLGELHHAVAAGFVDSGKLFPELGQVVAGLEQGRHTPDDITLCDLTGTGVQDTAIATLARNRAAQTKAGTIFES